MKQSLSASASPISMFDELEICSSTSTDCETSSFPQGPGLSDTDLVIYFTGDASKDDTDACSGVMGFAAYCHSNSRNRPIAGYINLCRSTIEETEVLTWEEVLSLIIHETFHVLGIGVYTDLRLSVYRRPTGFSSDGFDKFINDDGTERSDVYSVLEKRGKERAVITLPTVMEKARAFFGCPSMDGVELEDYGASSGAPTSHWENRVISYDFMISYVPPAAPYSLLTLAVMADSGWYSVDWRYAQEPPYGRNGGCSWSEDTCIVDGESIDESIFCTEKVEYSCSSSYVGKFYCGLSQWSADLPSEYQYFSQEHIGGDNTYPDFCPLFEEYSNGDCRLYGDNNVGTSDTNTAALGGMIAGNSKCALIYGEVNGVGAGCYPTECFTNSIGEYVGTRRTIYRNYKLTAFDVITCWSDEDGDAKSFPFDFSATQNYGFDTIYCPVFEDICYDENPWMCHGHGTIFNGSCVCSPGYFGVDCSIENNAANRALYPTESDRATSSVSIYDEVVCDGGGWNHDVNDSNVGIVDILVEGVQNYNEQYFRIALKNWMAVLTDISQCDVELMDYSHSDSSVSASVYYYSSHITYAETSKDEKNSVFRRLFVDGGYTDVTASEIKAAEGDHVDNIDAVGSLLNEPTFSVLLLAILLLNSC